MFKSLLWTPFSCLTKNCGTPFAILLLFSLYAICLLYIVINSSDLPSLWTSGERCRSKCLTVDGHQHRVIWLTMFEGHLYLPCSLVLNLSDSGQVQYQFCSDLWQISLIGAQQFLFQVLSPSHLHSCLPDDPWESSSSPFFISTLQV